MKNKKVVVVSDDQEDPLTASILYADKVMGFAFGPNVSKLILGMEAHPQKTVPSATLILPTKELIEALQYMLETITNDEELKQKLINAANKQIDTVRALKNS